LNLALSHYGRSHWQLNEREVKQLIAANWELDSHSRTHPPALPGLSPERLAEEVAGSRRIPRRMFHVPVDFFAYPSGGYDARVVAAVRNAGYRGASATLSGWARRDELYRLRRIAILRSDGVAGLAVKLSARALVRGVIED
jgi:peptidoglycan/xylan/chitin deacetylase (PgdA/CDA1 family)